MVYYRNQPDDVNPFKCELHQTLLDVLYFNPALKVINITLAYQNDENNVDFGVAEKQDVLKLLMTSAHELSAPIKKTFIGDRIHAIQVRKSRFLWMCILSLKFQTLFCVSYANKLFARITEIYIDLYGRERCDDINGMK